jgi:hypothetical protein
MTAGYLADNPLSLSRQQEREHYVRLRWLFSLLYLCSLRLSEVTQNSADGFFRREKGLAPFPSPDLGPFSYE